MVIRGNAETIYHPRGGCRRGRASLQRICFSRETAADTAMIGGLLLADVDPFILAPESS